MPPQHADFSGGAGNAVHFRPARLLAADLAVGLVCRFRCDGVDFGPLPVVDLGTAGFAAQCDEPSLEPGTVLEAMEIHLGDRPIWSGTATVVHATPGRIGARFDSGTLDTHRLQLEATLEGRLSTLREQRERLPAEWRAYVSDLRQLLEDARFEVEEFERSGHDDPLHRSEREEELFEGLRARWGASYYGAIAELHERSRSLDERARALARSYATSALMPLLMACPLHRRAYEKPLGYAGDFRMMELYFAREKAGDGLFGRLLHSVAQNYTLGRAVVAREVVMHHAVRDAVRTRGEAPARILSLAAGPAIELARLFEGTPEVNRPVELILLDQDVEAHETAHRRLTRLLVERQRGLLPVSVTCLHFSVRQLLKPQSPEDHRVVDAVLADLDLVYSAGLYDYLPDPVAARLTQILYGRLRHGGRLLLGNLVEAPDTTWLMDYVLGWSLHYRDEGAMLRLSTVLSPAPARAGITRDATGHCLFLDVTRP